MKYIYIFFKKSFFSLVFIEWNSLDHNIRKGRSFSVFINNIMKFIRPSSNSVFNFENHKGIKLITRLHFDLSHLREHKFKHIFQDTLNPICSCVFDVESTYHYILHCPMHDDERHTPEHHEKHWLLIARCDWNRFDKNVVWKLFCWCTH